ncbi:MAG TPA: hypothetical protein VNA25_05705 [Phycisphaerae bacterium]|nr:hypothetical protein [Phycisphaerae bacterium]
MSAPKGNLQCALYPSAFSGEIVFKLQTAQGEAYEGVAPKHYANPSAVMEAGTGGTVQVRVIGNGGNQARVAMPDGEVIDVPEQAVRQ